MAGAGWGWSDDLAGSDVPQVALFVRSIERFKSFAGERRIKLCQRPPPLLILVVASNRSISLSMTQANVSGGVLVLDCGSGSIFSKISATQY